jgi:hypothetical protein
MSKSDRDIMFMINIRYTTGGSRSYRMKGKRAVMKRVAKHMKEANVLHATAQQLNK